MQTKIIIGIVVLALAIGGVWFVKNQKMQTTDTDYVAKDLTPTPPPPPPVPGVTVTIPDPNAPKASRVKEFAMKSWMDKTADGKIAAHFSLATIDVKKGDTVRITITNTEGTHDFKIDEFKVAAETPEGKDTIVEFVADKVGDFEYYCSKYNHRSIGQKGVLHVTE